MKEYIEERAVAIANYIIEHNATVRQTAKKFGISKSTVHIKNIFRGNPMKEYIEERAVAIANYIIEHNATVRQTAKKFGISKSTVHIVVTI